MAAGPAPVLVLAILDVRSPGPALALLNLLYSIFISCCERQGRSQPEAKRHDGDAVAEVNHDETTKDFERTFLSLSVNKKK